MFILRHINTDLDKHKDADFLAILTFIYTLPKPTKLLTTWTSFSAKTLPLTTTAVV